MRTLIAFVLTLLAPAAVAQTNPAPSDLTNAQAVEPLKDIQGALKDCFKAERESNPDMPGQVVLSYTITEDGRPINVELDSLGGRPVVGCVQAAVATLHWPQFTGQRKQVSVPFTLPRAEASVVAEATPPSPGIVMGRASIAGGLTYAEVMMPLEGRREALNHCYKVALGKKLQLQRRVDVGLVIDDSGFVSSVDIGATEATFADCVAGALRGARFPIPAGGGQVKVGYPLILSNHVGTSDGGLDPAEISAVMARARPAIMQCYEAEFGRERAVAGRVTLNWLISRTGEVSDVVVLLDSMDNSTLIDCIIATIRSFRFPEPKGGGVVSVSYPLVFRTTRDAALITTGGMTLPTVSGGLAPAVVEEVITALSFESCADANADHIERADLRFAIGINGEVTTARTTASSMVKPEADSCIKDIIKSATFPVATSKTWVTWPLVLVPAASPPPPPPRKKEPPAPSPSGCVWPW